MWYKDLTWMTILYAYLLWIVIYFLLKVILSNKKVLGMFFFIVITYVALYYSYETGLIRNHDIYISLLITLPSAIIMINLAELRSAVSALFNKKNRKSALVMGNERTKLEILEATLALAKTQTGALITIEKHNTLDQFSQKAIMMNSDVSRELLINIFTPNTPLHDGAVIVRGDKIICAGAYFTLSANENFEKTTGSRHRAGLGISENSDSMTIIVSEETGSISIAIEGIMLKINDRVKLQEYLNMFMK
ncbi:DNA integrity scanning domain protein [Alteracholeplasma palmae J233]|uniref:Diadenylate cyclase n=1 Tax=Alteracholeplasma palmae (strain ATCC 49389 / J233) TaxID=1318466 RepID=U4KJR9_ALTPJ|nr:DNA integrity scanning protein DisA nucleotide-binding domain protein [Alteracholeplasma palmae]CCV63682.1 DNA integrity scanning domain protein [Alteracholeplasma palmae J233]